MEAVHIPWPTSVTFLHCWVLVATLWAQVHALELLEALCGANMGQRSLCNSHGETSWTQEGGALLETHRTFAKPQKVRTKCMSVSLAISTTFICFLWTSREITAWYVRKTSLICDIGIGDDSAPVQGQYDMPAVETSEAGWCVSLGWSKALRTSSFVPFCT